MKMGQSKLPLNPRLSETNDDGTFSTSIETSYATIDSLES